ncbi:armadillo repeat protein deleted in velo-cardio-facial syndrome [Vombatus ursinus]|uniref:armadillo repeat protein deleted in velo-cardio-facial syndrome n=1 Tax=Vombatus ursinus TaxID=29139 RepID=UPI000FFD6CB9|nr:armadillo repeat protein deleted in velo-cardio-facial syndrome [Vombatus ursinus]
MPAELTQEQSPGNQTSLAMMQEPQEMVEETVTVEEDPGTPTSHVSIVTSEDGTTRRTETKVTKMVKTVTTRTVRQVPLGPDGLPVLDGSSPLGSYTDSIDRRYLKNGERYLPPQASSTLTRSYNSYGEGPDGPYRSFHTHDASGGYGGAELPDGYGSLSRGIGYRPRYAYVPGNTYRPEDGSYTLPSRREAYGPPGAQPQVPPVGSGPDLTVSSRSQPERFQPEPYGLEDDNRSLGVDDEGYELDPDYSTVNRRLPVGVPERSRPHKGRAYDEPSESEMIDERIPYIHGGYAAPLAQPERGSMASIDRLGKRSPSIDSIRKDPRWRDPDLPEVIAMLSHPIDPVKSNAAAYLQHLCYENDKIKKDVRHLKGIAILVGLLDHPKAEVHRRACGALRNISYGRDHENKVAIKGCDGIPALIRLLRKTSDMEVRELITGTLWNLSSYEPLKMVIINHGLQTLTNEVIVPHSGWESEPNEDSKPRDAEWTTVFKNTSGCLRNVSSDGAEARRRLRECDGLVDALLHALQSAIGKKDTDNKSVENCVCIMRNLSYHVHKEVPGADKYQEPEASQAASTGALPRRKKDDASCFGSKKAKGKKNGGMDRNFDTLDLPKRSESAKGFELLYQPEVVRLYLSILTESQNFNTLEAAAGALQNLSAGTWMQTTREKEPPHSWGILSKATLPQGALQPGSGVFSPGTPGDLTRAGPCMRCTFMDRVCVGPLTGPLRPGLVVWVPTWASVCVDPYYRGRSYAMAELVRNLPSRQQRTAKNLEEDTVVAVLNTIHEIITDSAENARSLVQTQGIQKLVGISKSSQSMREMKAASHVLQMVWSYKELRGALQKDGWNKSHFQSAVSSTPKGSKGTPGKAGYDDSTLPLVEKTHDNERCGSRDMIPMDELGPDGYSTIDHRERKYRAGDPSGDASEKEPLKTDPARKPPHRSNRASVNLVDGRDPKPPPVDSWV